jgi:hypothetical protein
LAKECAKLPYYFPRHLREDGSGVVIHELRSAQQ